MTMLSKPVLEAAKMLAAKMPLDPNTDQATVLLALQALLSKAGQAVSPLSPKGANTLDALIKLQDLTPAQTPLLSCWLSLRALNLNPGDVIGVSKTTLDCPLFGALSQICALTPSIKSGEMVHGVYGDDVSKDVSKFINGVKSVYCDAQFIHLNINGVKTSHQISSDPKGALSEIDALRSKVGAQNAPSHILYTVLDNPQQPQFDTEIFTPYKVRRIDIAKAQTHPTPLVESAALASVMLPEVSYQPKILESVITSGALSDVQIEAIIYAGDAHSKFLEFHPNDPALRAPRQGILIGHGGGVGKGRIGAGIIADNWAQGRRRHIWVSESATLIDNARESWMVLGGKADDVIDIRNLSSAGNLPEMSGIIFVSYASLRSESGTGRIAQLIEWMMNEEGVILFDEAQGLRNTVPNITEAGWENAMSAQGKAALELQNALPNTRVAYLSATSASDIISLGYAIRLGLWGMNTSFPTPKAFFEEMERGGTNALEMVARDMKASGLYLAANLSYEGLEYERIEHRMSAQECAVHDAMSHIWQDVADGLRRAIRTTGIHSGPSVAITRTQKIPTIQFGQANARFFQATIAGMKTPAMIARMKEELDKGHSCVIQMANTFESNLSKAISSALEAGVDLDNVDASPRDILLDYLRKSFPIHFWEKVRGPRGMSMRLKKDPTTGQPLVCPVAQATLDDLIAKVESAHIPQGPLEQLFEEFGESNISEITGRKKRLVRDDMGKMVVQNRHEGDIKKDIDAFMNGPKRILVFSDAGGTGHTYSAQKNARNQTRRIHFLLQAGSRADKALQGMARTHRSFQAIEPHYILMGIDLWADQRMISRVAKSMKNLGAITKGLRQAASQEFFTQDDNIEDEYGFKAWHAFLVKLSDGKIPNLSLGQFKQESNLDLPSHIKADTPKSKIPNVRRFLNAMSAMTCASQEAFGYNYRLELTAARLEAVQEGRYDRGIETIQPDNLIKLEDSILYKDPRTGAQSRLLKMLRIDNIEQISFQDARKKAMSRGNAMIVKSLTTGRIAIVSMPKSLRELAPSASDRVYVYTPNGMKERTRAQIVSEGWTRVESALASALWEAEAKERGSDEEQTFWVVCGAMLPIWNKLPNGNMTVYRMQTDEGEQILGRILPEQFVSKLLVRFDALTNGGMDRNDVLETLSKKGTVSLSNGWTILGQSKQLGEQDTITLSVPLRDISLMSRLEGFGLMRKKSLRNSEFLMTFPADQKGLEISIKKLLDLSPAVSATAFS